MGHPVQYLDMVVNEAMRHAPVLGEVERLCVKDYIVPGTDFVIPKGALVQGGNSIGLKSPKK